MEQLECPEKILTAPENTPELPGGTMALDRMRALLSDKYCTAIASVIGDRTRAEDVREIIARSNTEGHMFHGIKRAEYIPGVLRLGIDMDAPELGGCADESFWTSGVEIFGKGLGGNGHGFDTSFFHYGHAYEPSGLRTVMALAVTNPKFLREVAGREYDFKSDGYMTIPFAVPRNAMHLLLAEIHHDRRPSGIAECRERGQQAEQMMLDLMTKALRNGYEKGGITRGFMRTA